jgi:hypothetical protein
LYSKVRMTYVADLIYTRVEGINSKSLIPKSFRNWKRKREKKNEKKNFHISFITSHSQIQCILDISYFLSFFYLILPPSTYTLTISDKIRPDRTTETVTICMANAPFISLSCCLFSEGVSFASRSFFYWASL